MNAIIGRNLKLYFRDRMVIFFSLLAAIIVMGLFFGFLSDNVSESLIKNGMARGEDFTNNWLVAGLLAITPASTALGILGIRIQDMVSGIDKDFASAPVTKSKLTMGYILCSCVVGVVMTLATVIIAQIFIFFAGGSFIPLDNWMLLLFSFVLTVFSNSAMMVFITSFISTQNAYSMVSSIVGSLLGFLTGMYVPVGALPGFAQVMIALFPSSHGAALLRQALTNGQYPEVNSHLLEGIENYMGNYYSIFGHRISTTESIIYLVLSAGLFFFLGYRRMAKKSN